MTRRTPAPEKAQLDSLPSSAITCGRANMMTCSAGVEFSSTFNDTCKHISASCGLNADIFPECVWTILQWLLLVRAWRFFETVIAPNSHPKFAAWYIDSCQILQHVGRHKLWSRFKVIRLDIDGETEFAAKRDWNRGAEWRDLWICQLSYGQIWSSGFGWRVLVPLWARNFFCGSIWGKASWLIFWSIEVIALWPWSIRRIPGFEVNQRPSEKC